MLTRTLLSSTAFFSLIFAWHTTHAAQTVTVNGMSVQTGSVYELDALLNSKASLDAFLAIIADYPRVLVDFYMEHCPPCHEMAPRFATLASECPGTLFIKVNINKHWAVADYYGIQAAPTFFSFFNKQIVKRLTGAMSKSKLKKESGIR